jgi:hypothetical protein
MLVLSISFMVIVLSACSSNTTNNESQRDVSKIEKSIFGHWVSKPDNPKYEDTHYYISKDNFIMVDQGTKKTMDYKINQSNDKENWLEISTEGLDNMGTLTRKLEFSNEDRTNLTEVMTAEDIKISSDRADSDENQQLVDLLQSVMGDKEVESKWEYVDELTEPK